MIKLRRNSRKITKPTFYNPMIESQRPQLQSTLKKQLKYKCSICKSSYHTRRTCRYVSVEDFAAMCLLMIRNRKH